MVRPKILKWVCLFLQSIFILSGCSFCDHAFILNKFSQENPKARVVNIQVGEGDADTAYYHIMYYLPFDQVEHEDVWQCFGDKSGPVIGNKERVR